MSEFVGLFHQKRHAYYSETMNTPELPWVQAHASREHSPIKIWLLTSAIILTTIFTIRLWSSSPTSTLMLPIVKASRSMRYDPALGHDNHAKTNTESFLPKRPGTMDNIKPLSAKATSSMSNVRAPNSRSGLQDLGLSVSAVNGWGNPLNYFGGTVFACFLLFAAHSLTKSTHACRQLQAFSAMSDDIVSDTTFETPRAHSRTMSFTDVGGSHQAKLELQEVVDFLKNPAKYTRLGATIPHGCLLTGLTGTGKTVLAKAVAGEAGVPCFIYSPTEFVEPPFSASARIRNMFAEAKRQCPCVVFVDELDLLGGDAVKNQLLAEMDNLAPGTVLIVLAATNRPDTLDQALVRRFDRKVVLQYPDTQERVEILEIAARNLAMAADVDYHKLASNLLGFSGEDLHNLLNEVSKFPTPNARFLLVTASSSWAVACYAPCVFVAVARLRVPPIVPCWT